MQEGAFRDKILKKVRQALMQESPNPYPALDLESNVLDKSEKELEVQFAQHYTDKGGKFIYCESIPEFTKEFQAVAVAKNWNKAYCEEEAIASCLKVANFSFAPRVDSDTDLAVVLCEQLIASGGNVMFSYNQPISHEYITSCPNLVVLAFASQIVWGLKEAMQHTSERTTEGKLPSNIYSVTAEALTNTELFLFLIDDKLHANV